MVNPDSSADVDSLVEKYNVGLRRTMDRHAPVVTRRVRDRPLAPWMSESVREARRVKRRSERRCRKYRLAISGYIYIKDRKAAGHIREEAKVNFYKSKIESAPNSKTLFNVANELMGAPKSKQLPPFFCALNSLKHFVISFLLKPLR